IRSAIATGSASLCSGRCSNPRTLASSAICQRSTPITIAVVRCRSSGDSASIRAECNSSSLCPLPSPTSFKISNAASRAAVISPTAASTEAVGPADTGRFFTRNGALTDALSLPDFVPPAPLLDLSLIAPIARRSAPDTPAKIQPHSSVASPPSVPHRAPAPSPRPPPAPHPPARPALQPRRQCHRRPHASSAQSASFRAEPYALPATAESHATDRRSASPSAKNQSTHPPASKSEPASPKNGLVSAKRDCPLQADAASPPSTPRPPEPGTHTHPPPTPPAQLAPPAPAAYRPCRVPHPAASSSLP